jgi:hypothetical protein
MLNPSDCLTPDWTAPANVRALATTRLGGVSERPYDTLNLGIAVGDRPEAVAENRARLSALLPAAPRWLRQVHGNTVVEADTVTAPVEADGAFTRTPGVVCVVQMADCMPVLFAADDGSVVAAAHAGWRGLAAGVLENTIASMDIDPGRLHAWLGPAIGPSRFEVGDEVRQAFLAQSPEASAAFVPHAPGKWLADLFLLARQRLGRAGVRHVTASGLCTMSDSTRFFSHRRDRVSGRMAALVWIDR